MNPAPDSMTAMLGSSPKDLLCTIEFYLPSYVPSSIHGFEPDHAEGLFATETATFRFSASVTVNYTREVFEPPSLTRHLAKQSNSVTVRLTNIPKPTTPTIRPLALFVLNNNVEGMRMVVRFISRAKLTTVEGSWVLFVGKCSKPDGFDRKEGTITAKQDLGQIEAVIPPRVFQKDCPLDFGGLECLGTEELTDKNAAYQTAFATLGRLGCNKTHSRCLDFENTEFFQGIRAAQIPGSFRYKPHHGLLYKLIRYTTPVGYLASKLFGRKPHNVGQSLEDGMPYGQVIPIVLGRAQIEGYPLQYRDDGETIRFLMAYARGPIADFHNIKCNDPAFSQPVSIVKHFGNYGGEADQDEDAVFPLHGFYSRLAYITGAVTGSDIEVEEPVPSISSMIAGIAPPKVILSLDSNAGEGSTDSPGVYQFINLGQSDNPVDLALFVLTDPALLNFSVNFFDEERTAKTSVYTLGAVQDNTNAERLVLPNDQNGKAGVDYHRYHSTGVIICTGSSGIPNTGPMFAGPNTEVEYEYYDPSSPPTSVPVKVRYRKRFSCNLALMEQGKAIDVLFDKILPSFRGFLSWDTRGRVGIRSERPSDSAHVRSASIAGATSIAVDDVLPWTGQFSENTPRVGQLLIGVGLATSEVREVLTTNYTTVGNLITLSAGATGSVTATASGANFTGGSSSVQASAAIEIDGTGADGDTVTATIDGEAVTYILEGSGYNKWKVASCLAFAINANRVLQKYIVAHADEFATVLLYSKQGVLNLSSALEEAHDIGEETIRVMMSFGDRALTYANVTQSNIRNGTFKYLGSNGQTRYNQFKGTYKNPLTDFSEVLVTINDYAHQDQIQKIQPLDIDLSAVDNYWQAAHLLNGAASKYGDLLDFFGWQSNGLALQLEEGDVVCVSHPAGDFRNQPVRIENLTTNAQYDVSLTGRKYATSAYDDFVEQTDVPLATGNTFGEPPASIAFNTTDFPPNGLVQSTDGSAGITSIRGGAIFPTRRFATFGIVRLIKRAGVTVNEQVALIHPDDNLEAVFEFIASAEGLYRVELQACNQWGCNTTKPTADITIGFGSIRGFWDTPMQQFSGAGSVEWTGGGNYNIP